MCFFALKGGAEKHLARVTVFPLRPLFSPDQIERASQFSYPYYSTSQEFRQAIN